MFEASNLLSLYDFVLGNRRFCSRLLDPEQAEPKYGAISALFSFTSYLVQHAHRSTRATSYSQLVLVMLRILAEDAALVKRMCEANADVRLCRQRPPNLPTTTGQRPLAAVVLDIAMDCLNHNLRTKLDILLYQQTIGIILRIVSHLARLKIRLPYHWPELWRSLLAFVRFLVQYAENLKQINGIELVVYGLVNLLGLCLTSGENLLPDSAPLEDLFYKLLESTAFLEKLGTAYKLSDSPVKANMAVLIDACRHFDKVTDQAGGKSKAVTAKEIMSHIRSGHETLSIEGDDGRTEYWEVYREQDYKVDIKRIIRTVVGDARLLAVY